jgi:hypothetical protein
MVNEIHELTPAGRIKRPSYSLVCSWVKAAWEKVDPSLIRKSFKCCGISVETDGTEDDEIFDYDNLMVNEDKENDNESGADSELEEGGENEEGGYNNWNEI